MSIQHNRSRFEFYGRKLRRARHLFMLFAHKHMITTIDINRVAFAMKEHGLYSAATGMRDIRYHLLRKKWKLSGGHDRPWPNPDDWSHWCQREGWSIGCWENVRTTARA